MLAAIVRASLRNPRIVTALACLIAAIGLAALLEARFDVFPDFAPPHVLVQTEAPGLDATQVEALVTRPLEEVLAGTENVKTVRSTSSQGLSAIQVVFDRGGDPYRQRQVVTERLAEFAGQLPPGVGAPLLSPLSSSMEYLVHFGYTSDRLSPLELRDVIQWIVKPQILAVPGVAQVQIFGGEVRERQIEIDPARLAAAGLTVDDVVTAAKHATALIGGGFVETPTQRIVIQAQAPGVTMEALARAVVGTRNGEAIRIRDVATVGEGAEPRFGDALIAGKPGILLETSTQFGANTLEVTRALEQRLDALAPALAKQGVEYHPALLRPASFIESAIEKLRNSLIIGAVLVVALLLIALRDWRGALVSFSAIPLALLTTIWLLQAGGLSLNTMTLGGLVVALGVVVDDAVIDVENILRRRRIATGGVDIGALFLGASLEVRRPVFYATAAVAVAFLPILTMSGLQGSFFRPLSISFLLAVGLSLLVAMSATPALGVLAMAHHLPKSEAGVLKHLKRGQVRAVAWLDGRPRTLVAIVAISGIAGIVLLPVLGARLLPDFRENYLIAHTSLRPGISLSETSRIGLQISKGLLAIRGVKSVSEQIGRAENGQDPDAPNKTEFEVQIDPSKGYDARAIDAAIRDVFDDYPNQLVEIYSVLAERIGETLSGESAPFTISVIGSDLDADDAVGARIVDVLKSLPDSGSVRLTVPPREVELHVELRPDRLELYGLEAEEALETLNAAYHGSVVSNLNQADRSIPVAVRIAGAGADPAAVGALLIRGRDGSVTPLSSVAKVELTAARSLVDHQDGLRRQIVVASPRGADQAGYAAAARKAIAAKVALPTGVYLRYGGAAEAQTTARNELLWHSAAAFVLIVLLLALAFGQARHVVLVVLSLPSTLIGGVAAVALTGGTLTIGAMVGFVALFGMAARNTILLVSHYDHLVHEEGQTWNLETAARGAEERLTPVLLTAALTGLALLPVALQLHQPGHEIEGPMAVVILGGLVSSTLVSLLLIPPLAARWLRPGKFPGKSATPDAGPASV
ncbi:MAG TPA: efflux RND transporter permease subunit [Steroidobacteraceae bacterium]|jgi:CzcA family heavy metal efflux pump|nr:efflux RND transporter permease subunit [Steroidobacteraceae bacterium]